MTNFKKHPSAPQGERAPLGTVLFLQNGKIIKVKDNIKFDKIIDILKNV